MITDIFEAEQKIGIHARKFFLPSWLWPNQRCWLFHGGKQIVCLGCHKISHPIQRSFLISVQDLTRCTYVDSDIDDDEGSESNFVVGDGDEDIDENQEAYLMQILKKDGRVSSSSDDNNGEDEDKFVRNQKPHIRHCGGTVARKMSTTKFARQSCKKNITQKSSKFLDIESPFVYELAEKLCSLNMEKMVELLTRVESFGGRCILEQLLDVLQMMEYDQGGSAVTKSYKPKSAKKCLKNEPKHDNDDFPPFDEKSKVEIEKRREAATKVLQNRIGEIIQSTSFNLDEPPQTPRRGKLAFLS
uniref:Uncharacterized protein n=1 Tax=Romanomermis culicivorax TaxID=13658 RepID=A0A915IF64_ROMCU